MDAVMDLAARAASFIGVIQQLCVDYSDRLKGKNLLYYLPSSSLEFKEHIKALKEEAVKNERFTDRAVQLMLISNANVNRVELAKCLLSREIKLLYWMREQQNLMVLSNNKMHEPLPTPEMWRNKISKILYQNPPQRTALARALSYLPIQVVLAAGGKAEGTLMQRILQEWNVSDRELEIILNKNDLINRRKFKGLNSGIITYLLEKDDVLVTTLTNQEVPLPFELVLTEELNEIEKNRQKRLKEQQLANPASGVTFSENGTAKHKNNKDSSKQTSDRSPLERAKSMQLLGLACSGGGIRSATFNLGILQGFAKAGLLSKIDYLSTVSGGGYIGSWLVTWIKRDGSVQKVADRLNPEKSTDPLGDEVRPIRWLRMYSNYLNPRAGIMSVDSWTVGMTVLRNMLLNQLIILLLIFSLLLSENALSIVWTKYITTVDDIIALISSSIFIVAASVLAGTGMRFYDKGKDGDEFKSNSPKKDLRIRISLLALCFIAAILVSGWFYGNSDRLEEYLTFRAVSSNLWLFGFGVITFGLLMVAILGRYDRCIPKPESKIWGSLLIVVFSGLAAALGCVLLALSWYALSIIEPGRYEKLAFALGPPLMVEALSLTIVFRMALLGNYFPDERREWWGRMGGTVHRIVFFWILIVGASIAGKEILEYVEDDENNFSKEVMTAAGGSWLALVVATVKVAFSSKSADDKSGNVSSLLKVIAKSGPYLFGLGLLIFLPVLLQKILETYFTGLADQLWPIFLLAAALGIITFFLSWRIGVNEFSLHHFYKNRLIRAYLGATINRAERSRNSSSFTGFSSIDDLKLYKLTNCHGYFGPYPILNATLNASEVSDLDRQDRKGESFVFCPLYCGFDFSRTRASANIGQKSYDYGYRPTKFYAYPDGPSVGTAMAISGAAANPNQGSHSSSATAFLLTAFNVRLGWWMGNPRKSYWKSSDPKLGFPYLVKDLAARSSTRDKYVCLSDGGHFDNMGLYELVRRRTSIIVLCDGEQDEKFVCEGLANSIRRCRIDFGVEIKIDVTKITERKDNFSEKSYAVGTIAYPDGKPTYGILIYLKSSVTRDQSQDVLEYTKKNPQFPHQSTGDQFFDESQFESYRKLGYNIAEAALADKMIGDVINPLINGNHFSFFPGVIKSVKERLGEIAKMIIKG